VRIDCHRILCCAADALVTVLEESLERLELMTESGGTTAWRSQTRVAAASAVMAAARAAHLCLPEHLLHKGTQLVCALLSNEAYQARVQGTRIVPMLLQAGARMQVCVPASSYRKRMELHTLRVAVLLCTPNANHAFDSALQEHWHEVQAELYLSTTQPAPDAAREPCMETSLLALGEPGYCHGWA
jgi:hypothetical protein